MCSRPYALKCNEHQIIRHNSVLKLSSQFRPFMAIPDAFKLTQINPALASNLEYGTNMSASIEL
jgi:hypothetical protein